MAGNLWEGDGGVCGTEVVNIGKYLEVCCLYTCMYFFPEFVSRILATLKTHDFAARLSGVRVREKMYLFPSMHDSPATLGKVPSVVLERWASGSVVEHNVFGAPVVEGRHVLPQRLTRLRPQVQGPKPLIDGSE